jgi:hypothetical protein
MALAMTLDEFQAERVAKAMAGNGLNFLDEFILKKAEQLGPCKHCSTMMINKGPTMWVRGHWQINVACDCRKSLFSVTLDS